ncbi:MAG: hypothetical protein MJZ10_01395 [Fibrobacter sp.]|nr:hypothetical protein [Fibrobacter sp.]
MPLTYTSKSVSAPKIASSTSASISDKSSQAGSLQRKADLVNASVPPIQRMVEQTTLDQYIAAYGPEISKTGTLHALQTLITNNIYPSSPLRFTDEYGGCGVVRDSKPPYKVIFLKIPKPDAPVDMTCPNVQNLSAKLDADSIKRMFAIHELEHLRLFYQNSQGNLQSLDYDYGEPSMNPNIKSMFVPLKRILCNHLHEAIPKGLNEKLKAYIEERLMYIQKPKSLEQSDESSENRTARELTTVLIELRTFCESLHDDRLALFESRVREAYERWK